MIFFVVFLFLKSWKKIFFFKHDCFTYEDVKTHLKLSSLIFSRKYNKIVSQISIRNSLFPGKYEKLFSLGKFVFFDGLEVFSEKLEEIRFFRVSIWIFFSYKIGSFKQTQKRFFSFGELLFWEGIRFFLAVSQVDWAMSLQIISRLYPSSTDWISSSCCCCCALFGEDSCCVVCWSVLPKMPGRFRCCKSIILPHCGKSKVERIAADTWILLILFAVVFDLI